MAVVLDSTDLFNSTIRNISSSVNRLVKRGVKPKLAVVKIGQDHPSESYIPIIRRYCGQVGIELQVVDVPDSMSEHYVLGVIRGLNDDYDVHGISVLSPVPKHMDAHNIARMVDPRKDVDCFHPRNIGCVVLNRLDVSLAPCSCSGVISLMKYYDIGMSGKNCVVVGKNNYVGIPMSIMLSHEDAAVTLVDRFDKNLHTYISNADIVIITSWLPSVVPSSVFKNDAVVIDFGNHVSGNRIVYSNVDFETLKWKASFISSPVHSIGPMTTAMLLNNTVLACEFQTTVRI